MEEEYDFSDGIRGQFCDPDAQRKLPVYLDAEIIEYFLAKAKLEGVELSTLLNEILKNDIDLIEGLK